MLVVVVALVMAQWAQEVQEAAVLEVEILLLLALQILAAVVEAREIQLALLGVLA
jgi:hypothetical protein